MVPNSPFVCVFLAARDAGSAMAAELREEELDAAAVQGLDEFHELASRRRLDVLVVSQELGLFLNGLELVERIQADLRHPSVILVGPLSKALRKKAEALGVAALIEDPGDLGRIRSNVVCRVAQLKLGATLVTPAARKFVADADIVRPMPQLLVKLCVYLKDDSASLNHLADDIACDPRMTAELIRLTNSPSLGLSRRVTSVPDAVRFLGVRPTIATVIGIGVRGSQASLFRKLPELVRAWYQSRSLLMACTAAAVAEELEGVSADTAHVLGLLQDLGTVVLAMAAPRQYEQLLRRAMTIGHVRLEHLEREEFGVCHAEVSAALLERWELPESLVTMVLDHHASGNRPGRPDVENRLLQAMRVAEAVANVADNRVPQRYQILASLLERYGSKRADECRYCFSTAALKARTQSDLFSIPVPSLEAIQEVLQEVAGSLPVSLVEAVADAPNVNPIASREDLEEVPLSCTVLVIEDAPELIVRRILESAGFAVLTARNSGEALSQVLDAGLAICDVHLGEDHGADLLQKFRMAGASAPVIMMSGDRSRETVTRCITAGAADYLLKPFTKEELLGKVRSCIDRICEAPPATIPLVRRA